MAHSRATYGKKLSNGSNDGYVATSKTVYDDVFGGPPKFAMPTRVEDYSDIFGSYHSTREFSIPILDLPLMEDEADGGLVDVRSSKFDYKEVFGGFDCLDFAVSYEELFASAEARGAVESSSSEDAWTPAETGSPSEGSSGEPTCLDNKKAYSNGELPDAYHDVKLFNMSYQKTNQISKEDGISGTTHIAHLNAVPAYTFVVDEDIPLQSEKFGKSPALEVNDNQSVNSNGGVVEGKDFQKTMSEEPACGVPLRNSSGIMEEKNFNKILSDGPACDTFTKTASSDVKSQSNLHENGTFPRKAFITVTEINLRTQPTHVPPPARPPPKLTIKQGESETSNLKASTGNAHEGARGDDSPPFFDVEIDASSSAAASAAAMKVAMEKAQARLKSAKESMERKRDGLQNRKKLGLKKEIKRKERKEGEIVEEIKGSKLHNNFEIEEIGLNGFDRDHRQREKTRDLNDSRESKGSMYVKGYRSTQHSGEQKRPGDWRAEEQFYELVKREKFETFAEVPEQERSERKSMPTTEVFGCEQNEKTTTKVVFEQQEGSDVKLKTAASKVQSEEDGKKHKEERELQESDNKVTEAFEREKHEKKLKEAREQQEQEKKLREAREQQEREKRLVEAREQQEQERKHKESREQQELERKLRESREQQEQEKRLEEAREQQEQERKHKESRKQHELERKLREAREQQEQDRKLKEAREMVEYEKKLKQAQEREEHERKLKESREQKENELKPKEAHQREENQKRQKEAREREENEKRLKESRELEEYAKKLKEVQELEESKIKQKQVREENERRLKEQEENENKLKQALEQAKLACEREENEKKLRELQEQKDLAEACKKEETEKREKEAFEKEENKKKQHEQICEREDHDTFKASQEFSGCNQGVENLIALKISRDIAGSENKMKADDDTFIQDIDTNSKATHAASEQGENCEKLNAVQDSSDHKGNENMMKAANYASQGKENKELKVTSDQDGRERLTCMVQNFPEHKGFENKEEVNQEKLKVPEEVMVQEKTDKCKKPEQVAFDLEDDKSKHKTVQGAKQQVANGKKMESANLVSDLEEKRSNLKMSNECDTKQNTERKEKIFNEKFIREEKEKEKEKEERLSREREQEKACLRKIEEEMERAREREKDRMAVERATREARERAYAEARERAERAAVERATAEVRQRALAEARERLERASAEAREKSLAEKASIEARLRAERAAVDRATAEARERAEKAMAERAAFEARERVERSVSEKFSGTSRDIGMRHSASFSDLRHPTYQSSSSFSGPLKFPNSSNHSVFANEKSQGAEVESAQRCKAKLERHQRTVERAAKALAEKNKRDVQVQREQAERNRLAETLDADVKRWSSGKEGNLRALLSTLQYILGPESGWQPVPLTDVITAVAVKKAYRKATLCVHPDKLQQRGANIQQKYICEKLFDLLKEAWNKFNSEER